MPSLATLISLIHVFGSEGEFNEDAASAPTKKRRAFFWLRLLI